MNSRNKAWHMLRESKWLSRAEIAIANFCALAVIASAGLFAYLFVAMLLSIPASDYYEDQVYADRMWLAIEEEVPFDPLSTFVLDSIESSSQIGYVIETDRIERHNLQGSHFVHTYFDRTDQGYVGNGIFLGNIGQLESIGAEAISSNPEPSSFRPLRDVAQLALVLAAGLFVVAVYMYAPFWLLALHRRHEQPAIDTSPEIVGQVHQETVHRSAA